MHLVLDEMWFAPRTLFWPILGFTFDKVDVTDWIFRMFLGLVLHPDVYIPELVGLIVVLWFGLDWSGRKKVVAFIKYGKVG